MQKYPPSSMSCSLHDTQQAEDDTRSTTDFVVKLRTAGLRPHAALIARS